MIILCAKLSAKEVEVYGDEMKDDLIRPVQALGEIAESLKSQSDLSCIPDSLLEILAGTLRAGSVSLFRKFYNEETNYALERLAIFSPDRREKQLQVQDPERSIKPDSLSEQSWHALESGRLAFIDDYLPDDFSASRNILLIPLFLEEHLFGFIAISDLENDSLSSSASDFAFALRGLFELWLLRSNVETRLLDVSNFIPDPTYLVNKKGEVTIWNKATERMTGWKAERILGKGDDENAIPFYSKRRPTVPRLIFNSDPLWESNYLEFRKDNGTVFSKAYCPALPGGGAFLTCKTTILYDINHREWGCIHTVRDVTRERQMEIDLHRSKYVFETITDFSGIGIVFFQNNRIIYYNDAFYNLFQMKNERINIEDFLDIITYVHPEDRYKTSFSFNKMLNSLQGPLKFQFRYQRDNKLSYFRCYAQVDEYGDNPTVHLIIDDVTKQVELSQKARLNELRMFHEDRLSALGVMATGIAHELNQPLNTIKVTADGLLLGRDEGWFLDEKELYDDLEMISGQVVRMSEVIQNIRFFARDDVKQSDTLVRPNDAIHNVFSMIGSQLEVHGIKVHQNLSPNLPVLRTTLSRLEQIVMNLIVNARQALDTCSHGRKQIWISTYATNNDMVCLEVEDNATGIPEDLMVKIFDPFFTTKEVGQGTGLGLTISSSIISDLNGSIDVYNNDKGGATFTVVIPAIGEQNEYPLS